MKSIQELNLPEDLRYSQDHEWVRGSEEKVMIGLTDYAQDQLGRIVYVELPQVRKVFKKGHVFGVIESAKTVSEMYMPISGEVSDVNGLLENSPHLVNKSPYQEGWMIEIKPSEFSEIDTLLKKEAYMEMLGKGDAD
jgi:glycine cleavage system H protein